MPPFYRFVHFGYTRNSAYCHINYTYCMRNVTPSDIKFYIFFLQGVEFMPVSMNWLLVQIREHPSRGLVRGVRIIPEYPAGDGCMTSEFQNMSVVGRLLDS